MEFFSDAYSATYSATYSAFIPLFCVGSAVNKKKKSPVTLAVTGLFFGPSDWNRTSGLLNPIQARYQTSPHPDMLFC